MVAIHSLVNLISFLSLLQIPSDLIILLLLCSYALVFRCAFSRHNAPYLIAIVLVLTHATTIALIPTQVSTAICLSMHGPMDGSILGFLLKLVLLLEVLVFEDVVLF